MAISAHRCRRGIPATWSAVPQSRDGDRVRDHVLQIVVAEGSWSAEKRDTPLATSSEPHDRYQHRFWPTPRRGGDRRLRPRRQLLHRPRRVNSRPQPDDQRPHRIQRMRWRPRRDGSRTRCRRRTPLRADRPHQGARRIKELAAATTIDRFTPPGREGLLDTVDLRRIDVPGG